MSQADSMLWMNKYKPKSTSEIIGNSFAIKKLKTWITSFKKVKNQNSAIVSGYHGIGKTTAVELVLREAGYYPQILYPNDVKSHKLMEEITLICLPTSLEEKSDIAFKRLDFSPI